MHISRPYPRSLQLSTTVASVDFAAARRGYLEAVRRRAISGADLDELAVDVAAIASASAQIVDLICGTRR